MKILFVGPTLPDASRIAPSAILCHGPVVQGDVYRAVQDGANAIGIIDGGFEFTAPVWHKEILFALEAGVRVIGAASMGALRAAECEAFGMEGIGQIFEDYRIGRRVDDGDVAQLHGPAALGWLALTEPLVNVTATLEALVADGTLDPTLADALQRAADRLFFKERTWPAILAAAAGLDDETRAGLGPLLSARRVDRKRLDALQLLEAMASMPDSRRDTARGWQFVRTVLWDEMLAQQRD